MGDSTKKRERLERQRDAKRWALIQLQSMTRTDKEKLPCCFEYRALHTGIEGFPPVCPPPGTSNKLDAMTLDDL